MPANNTENNKQPNDDQKPPGGVPPKSYVWIYIMLAVFFVITLYQSGQQSPKEYSWTKMKYEIIAEKDVAKIEIVNKTSAEIYIKSEKMGQGPHTHLKSGDRGPHYVVNIGSVDAFESSLQEIQKDWPPEDRIDVSYVSRTNWFTDVLSWIIPFIIIIAIWIFIFRRVGTSRGMGGMNPFDFGKSKAILFEAGKAVKVTFEDVAGLKEAKVEILEIVEFLKTPERFTRLGAKIPKGVMLVGPPGTGKTLLARAVAGEAQVPFFSISGSEFVEMFVGVGASRVRDLFKKAKEKAPSIIFIDEIDAIGRARGSAFSMRSNDERESTLNQLLTEMDGFDNNAGVIVLAATNRGDVLDNALLRPGRFDRHINLELPSLTERKAIFKVHMEPLRLGEDIDVEVLASQTPGFSGADIANMCNEAALIAARKKQDKIMMKDFYDAVDRIIAGMEKKSKIISPAEKRIIAYHEAGHATASWFLKHADTLMKVTIVPRGKSLGAAWYLPEEHLIYTKPQFYDRLCVALGGRAAEAIVFGEISSGALDDLEKVTKQAYTMVAYYGLNEELGNVSYYDSTGQYEQSLQKPYSEKTAQLIDQEVRKLIESAYNDTKKVLLEHRDQMDQLAQLLLSKEIVVKEDLEAIFGKRRADKSQPNNNPSTSDQEEE